MHRYLLIIYADDSYKVHKFLPNGASIILNPTGIFNEIDLLEKIKEFVILGNITDAWKTQFVARLSVVVDENLNFMRFG